MKNLKKLTLLHSNDMHGDFLAENVDENGLTYDITVPAGEEYIYAGAGIEYFPLKERNLRLHLAYYWDSDHNHRHNVVLGVTYKFNLAKL